MVRTREQLGLTEELANVPIHVEDEMWTLLETARHLYQAHRGGDTDPQTTLLIMVELDRLQEDADAVEDTELSGAAHALEDSARELFLQTA